MPIDEGSVAGTRARDWRVNFGPPEPSSALPCTFIALILISAGFEPIILVDEGSAPGTLESFSSLADSPSRPAGPSLFLG